VPPELPELPEPPEPLEPPEPPEPPELPEPTEVELSDVSAAPLELPALPPSELAPDDPEESPPQAGRHARAPTRMVPPRREIGSLLMAPR
jgi:hypothetical protein